MNSAPVPKRDEREAGMPNGPADTSELIAFEMLEKNLGRDSALEILRSFMFFAGQSISELKRAVRSGNTKQARVLVHELSNSCHVIGAANVLRSCILLEQELADPDWQKVKTATDALTAETKAVAQCIEKLLS
jgi:HPt (histidine-containing phosphotransfer) domain-containing protein